MHIDQRQVTTVCVRDGRERDFVLRPDGLGFKLSLVSRDDVVNIFLAARDLQKLRQEVGRWDFKDYRKDAACVEPKAARHEHELSWEEVYATPMTSEVGPFSWSNVDWLSYN
jgi:hypothetical protein